MSLNIPFNSTHTIVWDKENGDSFMSDGEIAFTSFDKKLQNFIDYFGCLIWWNHMKNH